MNRPNLFLIDVTDIDRSTAFYADLFEMEPVIRTPRYVPFEVAPGVLFALWTGRSDRLAGGATGEVGLMLPGGTAAVDRIHQEWLARGVEIITPPHDDVFGRTFVAADPDGNLVRVSPVD